MKDIIIKYCKKAVTSARNLFDFVLAVLALLSVVITSAYVLFSPIVVFSTSGDWQWLLIYVIYAYLMYLCYRVLK